MKFLELDPERRTLLLALDQAVELDEVTWWHKPQGSVVRHARGYRLTTPPAPPVPMEPPPPDADPMTRFAWVTGG